MRACPHAYTSLYPRLLLFDKNLKTNSSKFPIENHSTKEVPSERSSVNSRLGNNR